jgi:hypothetical protein
MSYRLENWNTVGYGDRYGPPELVSLHLQGDIYGREPRFKDGSFVTTSRIVKVEGNKVETYSGSTYELGTPDPIFVKWCQDNGHHVPTPEEPIKPLRSFEEE